MSKIITANHLKTGAALYLSASKRWTSKVSEAIVANTPEQEAALLAKAQKAEEENLVINPALIEVRLKDKVIIPTARLEFIRSKGPTVRTDLGYQADETGA